MISALLNTMTAMIMFIAFVIWNNTPIVLAYKAST
jgi:hypothetical protein